MSILIPYLGLSKEETPSGENTINSPMRLILNGNRRYNQKVCK